MPRAILIDTSRGWIEFLIKNELSRLLLESKLLDPAYVPLSSPNVYAPLTPSPSSPVSEKPIKSPDPLPVSIHIILTESFHQSAPFPQDLTHQLGLASLFQSDAEFMEFIPFPLRRYDGTEKRVMPRDPRLAALKPGKLLIVAKSGYVLREGAGDIDTWTMRVQEHGYEIVGLTREVGEKLEAEELEGAVNETSALSSSASTSAPNSISTGVVSSTRVRPIERPRSNTISVPPRPSTPAPFPTRASTPAPVPAPAPLLHPLPARPRPSSIPPTIARPSTPLFNRAASMSSRSSTNSYPSSHHVEPLGQENVPLDPYSYHQASSPAPDRQPRPRSSSASPNDRVPSGHGAMSRPINESQLLELIAAETLHSTSSSATTSNRVASRPRNDLQFLRDRTARRTENDPSLSRSASTRMGLVGNNMAQASAGFGGGDALPSLFPAHPALPDMASHSDGWYGAPPMQPVPNFVPAYHHVPPSSFAPTQAPFTPIPLPLNANPPMAPRLSHAVARYRSSFLPPSSSMFVPGHKRDRSVHRWMLPLPDVDMVQPHDGPRHFGPGPMEVDLVNMNPQFGGFANSSPKRDGKRKAYELEDADDDGRGTIYPPGTYRAISARGSSGPNARVRHFIATGYASDKVIRDASEPIPACLTQAGYVEYFPDWEEIFPFAAPTATFASGPAPVPGPTPAIAPAPALADQGEEAEEEDEAEEEEEEEEEEERDYDNERLQRYPPHFGGPERFAGSRMLDPHRRIDKRYTLEVPAASPPPGTTRVDVKCVPADSTREPYVVKDTRQSAQFVMRLPDWYLPPKEKYMLMLVEVRFDVPVYNEVTRTTRTVACIGRTLHIVSRRATTGPAAGSAA